MNQAPKRCAAAHGEDEIRVDGLLVYANDLMRLAARSSPNYCLRDSVECSHNGNTNAGGDGTRVTINYRAVERRIDVETTMTRNGYAY